MPRQLFVNLPVRDLERTVSFWSGLGFTFVPEYVDVRTAAMVLNEQAFVMFLTEDFYRTFTREEVPQGSGCILCLTADSRDEVDALVGRAVATGGTPASDPMEDGPYYGWSFRDLDGHQWEVMHMAAPTPS